MALRRKKTPVYHSLEDISFQESLYKMLLKIYSFKKREDLEFLKSEEFLKECGLKKLHFKFKEEESKEEEVGITWSSRLKFPLEFKGEAFGEILFFSQTKIPAEKKGFPKEAFRSPFLKSSPHQRKRKTERFNQAVEVSL